MNDDNPKWLRRAGLANSVGMVLVISTLIGGGIGWIIDKTFNTKPIWMLIIGLLGVAAGFIEVYKIVVEIAKEEDRDEDQNKWKKT